MTAHIKVYAVLHKFGNDQKVRHKYRKDITCYYDFETGGNLGGFKPKSYHDGKPAKDLNFGQVS